MKPLGVALIGYGGIARSHAQGWRDLGLHYALPADTVRVIGVATRRQDSAETAAAELGCAIATTDAASLIQRDDVDVVDICAPTAAHLEYVRLSAAAGKHVYLEKPVAASLADARVIAATVASSGVTCQVNFNYRWLPAAQRMRALIDEGFLGAISSVRARYCRSSHASAARPRTWRHILAESGGGAFADLGAHIIDLVSWMAGPIAEVMAESRIVIARRPVSSGASELGPVDTDDETRALVRFASGARGTLEASRVAVGTANDLVVEIYGDKGALRYSLEDPNWLWAYDGAAPESRRGWTRVETIQRYAGALHPDWAAAVGVARGHAESQYRFARAVWDRTKADPGIETGVAVQAVIDAVYRSAAQRAWTRVEQEPI
ncbi:MAG TPA: Gfo/Idh/MocA family oxidoreductase [Thermoflexales bacterium]|nr:Gfo/Idh/MocA family oxidoreductase [Thermoflexales bacterium]HQX10253.1 Gfo/Idh/MocA family oxidoreductase [Thermoflexales bacterium]HQY24367.1 Gfo/Idh/MocA family oxidoreductase [Thermoflexales bacterium]